MPQQYSKKQFWKLYEKLPRELKDALFDEEMGNDIYEICIANDVGNHLEEIVELVGQVLVGLLPSQDFSKALQGLKIKKDVADKIARGINRFAFYPVKPALEQLYQMPETKEGGQVVTQRTIKKTIAPNKGLKKSTSLPGVKDPYRESANDDEE
ncbi:MAG: hypothetical protein KJI69_02650 [Patescibacteria group bacterium]|nr:hypothetical protein [Patescibacteria group bacterium]